jgi:hypothetical protein
MRRHHIASNEQARKQKEDVFQGRQVDFRTCFSKVLRINNKTILLVAKTLNNKNAQLFYFKTGSTSSAEIQLGLILESIARES